MLTTSFISVIILAVAAGSAAKTWGPSRFPESVACAGVRCHYFFLSILATTTPTTPTWLRGAILADKRLRAEEEEE